MNKHTNGSSPEAIVNGHILESSEHQMEALASINEMISEMRRYFMTYLNSAKAALRESQHKLEIAHSGLAQLRTA